MENCYYRYQFIGDIEDAFQFGDICFPEWEALLTSWPTQIEAVFYGTATPEQAEALEKVCCGVCCSTRDEAEDKAFFGEEFVTGCSEAPVDETTWVYIFPDDQQIAIKDVTTEVPFSGGYTLLSTKWGDTFMIPPRWLCMHRQ